MSRFAALYSTLHSFAKPLTVALHERDSHTRSHSDRVAEVSERLGRQCDLTDDDIDILKVCAAFHDIGKIGIPDKILLKPGGFEAPEWAVMKTHTEIGERIVRGIDAEGVDEVANSVRHHHEYFNGNGYPDGLSGEAIPIYARILSIADSYDAIVMPRTYHRGRSFRETLDILQQEEGAKHDPFLLGKFFAMIQCG